MSDPFDSEQNAAMYLPRESTEILKECGVDFIMMGGPHWRSMSKRDQRHDGPAVEVEVFRQEP